MITTAMSNPSIDCLDTFLTHVRSLDWAAIKNPIAEIKKILTNVPGYIPGTPGINLHYDLSETNDENGPQQSGRIILSTAFMAVPVCKFHHEANGIILSFPQWNVLSLPPPIMRSEARNVILKRLSQYAVYTVLDGTVITLYYYNGAWVMASSNGYDIGSYTRLGNTTFQQALNEVLAIYPEFSYDKLNREYSYTIGFKHEAFHPLPGPRNAWFISAKSNVSLADAEVHIGLPHQPRAWLPKGYKNACAFIRRSCDIALSAYDAQEPKTHVLGFIFRTATENILLESTLMTRVRKLAYNIPKKEKITNIDTFIALRAYLKVKTSTQFINLFPQYKTKYAQFDEFFGTLTGKIQCPDVVVTLPTANSTDDNVVNETVSIDKLACQFANQLRGIVDITHITSRSVIRDFVMNEKYISLYLEIMPTYNR